MLVYLWSAGLRADCRAGEPLALQFAVIFFLVQRKGPASRERPGPDPLRAYLYNHVKDEQFYRRAAAQGSRWIASADPSYRGGEIVTECSRVNAEECV